MDPARSGCGPGNPETCLLSPNKDLDAWELLLLLLCLSLWITPLQSYVAFIVNVNQVAHVGRGKDLPPVSFHQMWKCKGWFRHKGSPQETFGSYQWVWSAKGLRSVGTTLTVIGPYQNTAQFTSVQWQVGIDFEEVMICTSEVFNHLL